MPQSAARTRKHGPPMRRSADEHLRGEPRRTHQSPSLQLWLYTARFVKSPLPDSNRRPFRTMAVGLVRQRRRGRQSAWYARKPYAADAGNPAQRSARPLPTRVPGREGENLARAGIQSGSPVPGGRRTARSQPHAL
jgi:hypothetical protein